jgi:FG-GAP repeat protein
MPGPPADRRWRSPPGAASLTGRAAATRLRRKLPILARAAFPWRLLLLAGALCALIAGALTRGLVERPASLVAPAGTAGQKSLAALPLAAQGPFSAAIGGDRAAFRVSSLGIGTFTARNPQQDLSARFSRSGLTVSSHTLHASLRLRSIAYGNSVRPVAQVKPTASGNRVTYAHPGVEEWYANGPLGLEQGFTLGAPETTRPGGALTLTLDLSANAGMSMSRDGRTLQFGHGGRTLRYDGLLVTDASGRRLDSRLELSGDTLLIRVGTRGARYPLRIDPLIQQGNKLVPGDETGPGSEAGTSVAMSADGNTALVGGIGDEPHGKPMEGAAWVFTRSGSTWSQQAKLTGGGEQGEGQFGISVALSADGNTALVGGINDETAGKQVGAAWVFTRSGSTWTQQGAKLTGGGEEGLNGRFGKSVALSGDGNTALVGAYFDENAKKEPQGGSAFVFTRSGGAWKHQGAKLTGSNEEGLAEFGISVALSADGNTALVGGPNDEGKAKLSMSGAAWVFTRSGASWAQQGSKLTGAGESGPGELGWSVALSADGNTALAGAPADGDGAAFAFARTGTTWTQQGSKLVPSDATTGAAFGSGVALSADGTLALIGGPTDKDSSVPTGAAWEFARTGSSWAQQLGKILGSGEAPESEFGAAVALAADGDTALLGAPIDAVNTGAGWVFVHPPPDASSDAASSVGTNTATLNGSVVRGASATAHFEYGTSSAYGNSTAVQSVQPLYPGGPIVPAIAILQSLSANVAGLYPNTTYHYRLVVQNSAGTSVSGDRTFITPITPCACVGLVPPPAALRPILSRVSQSHARWRVGSAAARLTASLGSRTASAAKSKPKAKVRRPPLGTAFSFTLNVAASVKLTFTHPVTGRKVRRRCVAQSKSNRRRPACKRAVTLATRLVLAARSGPNKISFQGVLDGKKLAPGTYTVRLVATNAGLTSASKSLTFAVVR